MRQQDTQLFQDTLMKVRHGFAVLALVSISALATACGGGGSDDEDEDDGGNGGDDIAAFVGTWSITEHTIDECTDEEYTETHEIVITQNGDTLTMDDGVEDAVELDVDGDTISWTVNVEEDGYSGSIEGSATVSGDTMTGESEWSVSGDGVSCSGSSTFTGVRVSDDGNDDGSGDGDGGGTADAEEVEPNNDMPNATVIAMSGTSVTYAGEVDDTTDISDYFAFAPSVSGSYTITMDGLDAMDDNDLYLYDSNGVEQSASDDFGADGEITTTLSAGLVYYIEIVGYETLTGGEYHLTITRN